MAKLGKKKKETVAEKPKPTKIPLPASDSALVIDLPDGQKLVVGKMEFGTVIEVATWRGTGRPDSRTNRLMLGMSSSAAEAEENQQENSSSTEEKAKDLTRFQIAINVSLKALRGLIPKLQAIFSKLIGKLKFRISKKSSNGLNGVTEIRAHSSEIDPDIREWLNQVTAKSQAKREKSEASSKKGSRKSTIKRK
jgi:hypothetical protein